MENKRFNLLENALYLSSSDDKGQQLTRLDTVSGFDRLSWCTKRLDNEDTQHI